MMHPVSAELSGRVDISIDLETLSTRPDAAILSIGAAAFDRDTGVVVDTLYLVIETDSAMSMGHVSASTLQWWMSQSDDARAVWTATGRVGLFPALQSLREYVARHQGAHVWGNGATFDIGILESAYAKFEMPAPWSFWSIRDMRTIVDAATELGFDKTTIPFDGTRHNAVHDAIHQARVISACWNKVTKCTLGETVSVAWALITPGGNIRYWSFDRSAVERQHVDCPNEVLLPVLKGRDDARRLRAVSTALTGKDDSTEAEVMGCIEKLSEYFTDGKCAQHSPAGDAADSSRPDILNALEDADLYRQKLDADRFVWTLPIMTGSDEADANLRTRAVAGAMLKGLTGRELIDHAIQLYNAAKE